MGGARPRPRAPGRRAEGDAARGALPAVIEREARVLALLPHGGHARWKRAAGTSRVGCGLPVPKGRRRSSCSASGRPSTPPGTTASTRSTGTRSARCERLAGVRGERRRKGSISAARSRGRRPCGGRRSGAGAGAGEERRVEVEGRDAAARAAARAVAVEGDQKGRRQRSTRREATIPTTPGCQPSPARTIARLAGLLRAGRLGPTRMRSRALALGVEPVEPRASSRGRAAVLGQQQLERRIAPPHPTGRVDPRPSRKPSAPGRAPPLDGRDRHQRAQPRLLRCARGASGHRARCAGSRRAAARGRHRGERHEVEVVRARGRARRRVERLARASARRRLRRAPGRRSRRAPDARPRSRGAVAGQVVVGDHDVEAGGPRRGDRLDRGDAAVDRDQQAPPRSASRSTGAVEGRSRREAAGQLPDGSAPSARSVRTRIAVEQRPSTS